LEVFPDQGDGDMAANPKALKDVNYLGYRVLDHHFGAAGDDPEYPLIFRAWQVGYLRGLMQAVGV
jgi:D-mannonate dehydratase